MTKPNNSWEIELELLIRKYLYIDPNGLDHWKKLAKMMGENCKVCGKPLVPNKYADEFEKKLLKAITKTLQQQREEDYKKFEEIIGEDEKIRRIMTADGYWTAEPYEYERNRLRQEQREKLQSLKQENK